MLRLCQAFLLPHLFTGLRDGTSVKESVTNGHLRTIMAIYLTWPVPIYMHVGYIFDSGFSE